MLPKPNEPFPYGRLHNEVPDEGAQMFKEVAHCGYKVLDILSQLCLPLGEICSEDHYEKIGKEPTEPVECSDYVIHNNLQFQ